MDVSIIAEKDFDVKDVENPGFDNDTRDIRPGVGPAKRPGEHGAGQPFRTASSSSQRAKAVACSRSTVSSRAFTSVNFAACFL